MWTDLRTEEELIELLGIYSCSEDVGLQRVGDRHHEVRDIAKTEEDIADMATLNKNILKPLGIMVALTDQALRVGPDIG